MLSGLGSLTCFLSFWMTYSFLYGFPKCLDTWWDHGIFARATFIRLENSYCISCSLQDLLFFSTVIKLILSFIASLRVTVCMFITLSNKECNIWNIVEIQFCKSVRLGREFSIDSFLTENEVFRISVSLRYSMEQLSLKLSSSMAKFDKSFFSFSFSLRKSEAEHLMLIPIDLNENRFKQSSVFPVEQLNFILDGLRAQWELNVTDPHFSFRLTLEAIIHLLWGTTFSTSSWTASASHRNHLMLMYHRKRSLP